MRTTLLILALITVCTAHALPLEDMELETAESRRAQGWFKGVGYGGFSFGEDGETEEKPDDSETTSRTEDVGPAQFSNIKTQEPNYRTIKGIKYGISQQQGGLVTDSEDAAVTEQQEAGSEVDQGGRRKGGQQKGQANEGVENSGRKQGRGSSQGENGKNKNQQSGNQQGQGNKQTARQEQKQEANVGAADFYFGKRNQQPGYKGHSRQLAQKEYAIVEVADEDSQEEGEVEEAAKEEEEKEEEVKEEKSDAESEEQKSEQLFGGFYNFNKKSQEQTAVKKQQAGAGYPGFAFSAIHQTSFFHNTPRSHQNQRQQQQKQQQQQQEEEKEEEKEQEKPQEEKQEEEKIEAVKLPEGFTFQFVLPSKH